VSARRHRTINWVALVTAIGAGVGSGVQAYTGGTTEESLKQVMSAELAAYREWRRATIEDLKHLESTKETLQAEVAALKAVVGLLSKGNRRDAKPILEALEQPPGVSADDEVEVIGIERKGPRNRPSATKVNRKIKLKSMSSEKPSHKQVQQVRQELFKDAGVAEDVKDGN